MDALKNLLYNEHGLVGVGLIIAATVLTGLGKMTVDQWISYSQWCFGIYAAATAIPAAAGAIGSKSARPVAAPAMPAPSTTTEQAK